MSSERNLHLVRFATDTESFVAGQTVFSEGEPGEVMYVVKEGEVDIRVRDTTVETVGPGGLIGEMALIDRNPRSATAVARTDCKLVPINEARFAFLVQETPFFALDVMRMMVRRLRKMDAEGLS